MTSKEDISWILFEKYLQSRYIMEGYPNLRFKLQNERVSVYKLWQQCPSQTGGFTMWPVFTVAAQITGKTFLSNCLAFIYYVTPKIINRKSKKCRILKALSISSVTHTNTHSIIDNATTKYEEFLWGKAINQSVLMKWKYRDFLNNTLNFIICIITFVNNKWSTYK